jgi:ribonucleoside-diphosphate reductase subunit M2
METDLRHWKHELNKSERKFLRLIFAFFTFGDGMVIENLVRNFMNEIQDQDVKFVYLAQSFFETIHATTYAMILDTLVKKESKMQYLENLFNTDETFIELKEWLEKYMDAKIYSFATRLLAFGCFEGIIFSGAFCAIFWLKKRGLMPGLTFSNELISRDEGIHSDFACLLYNLLSKSLPYHEAIEVVASSVKVAKAFVIRVVPCDLLGINSELMSQYIEFVANRFFYCLEAYRDCFKPYPEASNPFDWMILSSLQGKTNFFERRVGEYSNAAMVSSINSGGGGGGGGGGGRLKNSGYESASGEKEEPWDDNVFTTDADF